MYASTGNDAYRKKGDSIVYVMEECQRTLKQDGYLSAFPPNFIDRVIAGKRVWAPWYTIHKIMAGLLDMYTCTGNTMALDVVSKMSGWAHRKLKPLKPEQLAVMLRNEFGGMSETAWNLYAVTGRPEDKELAGMFFDHRVLDPLAAGKDNLAKLHANTQIPKMSGAARGFELTGEDQLNRISTFFWQTVHDHHTFANGGNSNHEMFFAPDKLSEHMSDCNTETCNTYNMLKLTRHLFTWSGDARYADYYEQALYNHILAAQDQATGMTSYFTPFKPGLFKVFSSPETCFWCCVGTAFESNAKLAEAIYYHSENGVYVNLFVPSELTWNEKGFKLVQQTRYPEEPASHLVIETAGSKKISLMIRYPSWAQKGAVVQVNGRSVAVKTKPGSYITLDRKWKNGDRIDFSFPMELRLVPANDKPSLVAVACGPVVLAGLMGKEGIPATAPYVLDDQTELYGKIPASVDSTLVLGGKPLSDRIKPVSGKTLTFETQGSSGRMITLVPFYRLKDERFVFYWNIK